MATGVSKTSIRQLRPFIAGDWCEPRADTRSTISSPVSGDPLAEVPNLTAASVSDAVSAARAAQPAWEATSVWERAARCHRIADLIDRHERELASQLTIEQGKPLEGEAIVEVRTSAELFRIAAEDAKRLYSDVIPVADVGKRLLTFRRANGVYAVITPWNFPLLTPSELVAPAIATGNTVVLKPSEWTPISASLLVELIAEAGLPDGVVNLVYGGGEVGHGLVTADVDGIAFIGSHATGERILQEAGFRRALIEASGNGPVIVCDDADIELAARGAVSGSFANAGQICCATERVVAAEGVHEDFVDAVLRETRNWEVGDPLEPSTRVGPMNNEPTAQRVDEHLEDARSIGAEVLVGGARDGDRPTELYYRPTVVDGVTPDARLYREETFGPVLPIIRATGDDDAIRIANDSELGLQVSVYTDSLSRAFRFADAIRAGNVVVNDSPLWWEPHVPFGGAAGTKTGTGRYGGRAAVMEMTHLRALALDVAAHP